MEEMMTTAPETVIDAPAEDIAAPETGQPAEAPAEETAKPKGEKSSSYAEMRRRVKAMEREAADKSAKMERLVKALETAGHTGTPEEMADKLEAEAKGITVAELAKERNRMSEAIKQHPDFKRAEEERDEYKSLYERRMFQDHLAAIKAAHPEETAEDITDLGETFISLMAMKQRKGEVSSEDVLIAYEMAALERNRKTKPVPESPGKLNSTNGGEKEFYSPAEVDRLSEKQLNDPKILQRVMESMTRW
jgi:hypothetical protein